MCKAVAKDLDCSESYQRLCVCTEVHIRLERLVGAKSKLFEVGASTYLYLILNIVEDIGESKSTRAAL